MFTLKVTQALARMGLDVLTLGAVERDALLSASVLLERATPDRVSTYEDLSLEANALLPAPNDHANCLRLFWGTKRHLEDASFSNLADLATFISQRADTLESAGNTLHNDSKSLQSWAAALGRLAEGYSYTIEAALTLESMGIIPMRQREEFEQLTTMPNEDSNYAGSMLFMKAMALYTARKSNEQFAPSEKFG